MPYILCRYLEQAFDTEVVRQQDATYVIRYVADNYVGRALAWDFTRANWDRLREEYVQNENKIEQSNKPFRKLGIDVPVSKVTEDKYTFKIQFSWYLHNIWQTGEIIIFCLKITHHEGGW